MFSDRARYRTTTKYALSLAAAGAALPLRGVARVLARRPPSDPHEWRRALIVGHSHIGDVLYRTASLGPLAAAFPQCEWHYLAAPGSAELLRGNPHLAAVHGVSTGDEAWQLAPGALSALRALDVDAVLCTNSVRYYSDLALALRLCAPNRVAFTYKGLGALVTHPAPIEFPSPYPAYFRGMVAALAGTAPTWDLRPRVYPSPDDGRRARDAWRELGLDDGAPVVACVLTKRQSGEIWPLPHWREALGRVFDATGAVTVFCGASGDAPLLTSVARDARFPARVLAGRLGLLAFAEFLRRTSVYFGVDSGPRHVANAVGTPVVFFRHLGFWRAEADRYCDTEVDLSPADKELLTPAEQRAALERISPHAAAESVISAMVTTRRRGGDD